uniref:Selenoprotein T n=1 Tax=Strombidium rassoulzadegani TaxID=1082188 RepID=A0A7S3CL02_9SPIT|mmetsp:Transcript_1522/g.2696  ORF Transcript_1522/g.2696 Transcript_1522/m.2696 type:complete len:143 (+) Transcript_1522:687-1115(+)
MDYYKNRNTAANPDDVTMPNVQISGQHYEVKGGKALISSVVSYVRILCFVLIFAGDLIFQALGGLHKMPEPVQEFYGYVKENKLQFGVGAFFIGSMIQAQMLQSGAFEIYVNGNLEYSKLQTGQMPTFEIVQHLLHQYNVPI